MAQLLPQVGKLSIIFVLVFGFVFLQIVHANQAPQNININNNNENNNTNNNNLSVGGNVIVLFSPTPSPTVTPTPSPTPTPTPIVTTTTVIIATATSQPVVISQTVQPQVKQLPNTGLPLASLGLLALIPLGWRLKKFTLNHLKAGSIWEGRELRK